MADAKEVWIKYLDGAKDEDEKEQRLKIMKDVIKRVFGNEEFKLSQAVPSQSPLVEYFVDEIKQLL